MGRIYRLFNVPNITLALIAAQAVAYVMVMMQMLDASVINLQADKVLAGEFWRVLTFVVDPPAAHPIFVLFAWYLFYIFGSSMEHMWGAGKYNLFLLVGFVLSVAIAFVTLVLPQSAAVSNGFVMTSVFLAFAFYNPNFTIMLFFILPVKIKWLALLTWLGLCFAVLSGGLAIQLMIGASVTNYFLFLGADIARKIRYGQRQVSDQVRQIKDAKVPFHTCTVCGITDKTHPDMKFRYCAACHGSPGYCEEHINSHEHIVSPASTDDEVD